MKEISTTKRRKQSAKQLQQMFGVDEFSLKIEQIIECGKRSVDLLNFEVGKMLVESILLMDRENIAGPDYSPYDGYYKWAQQQGSVYLGDQKIKISKPRLRRMGQEVQLPSYLKLKERGQFSESMLTQMMSGLSARRYHETVTDAANAFGVSPSSVSRHFIEATAKQLKEFLVRDLSKFKLFAMMLDTVHRGGVAFVTALGVSTTGQKMVLGYWEGATENSELCLELLTDLETRNLKLSSNQIYITDGGKGIIKALKDKFGKKLLHQRCTIHKDRNIQKHLAKKYRKRVHELFKKAMSHAKHDDAEKALQALEKELMTMSMSAARSLREAMYELLTLHRLGITDDLYRSLHTTNGIENLFSSVRHREKNIKNYNPNYRGKPVKKKLSERWLVAVFLKAEENFRTVKGFEKINAVIKHIEKIQSVTVDKKMKAA